MSDNVNYPKHYRAHPSGIEVIQITEHMNFCLGNAVKYILRCDHKNNAIEDLKKAAWYIQREIELRGTTAAFAESNAVRSCKHDPFCLGTGCAICGSHPEVK